MSYIYTRASSRIRVNNSHWNSLPHTHANDLAFLISDINPTNKNSQLQNPVSRKWPYNINTLLKIFETCSKPGSYHGQRSIILWFYYMYCIFVLTHWGWVTHICVSKLTIIGSDNGLSPGRRQAIIWTNAGILLIRPLGTNFNGMLIEILTFSFMKMHLKVSSAKGVHFVSASMC